MQRLIFVFALLTTSFLNPGVTLAASDKPDSSYFSNDTTRYFLRFQNRIVIDQDSGNFLASPGYPILPYTPLVFQVTDSIFLNPSVPFPQKNFFSLNPRFAFNGQRPNTLVQTDINSFKEQLFTIAHKRDFGRSAGIWFKIFSCRTPGVFSNFIGNSFAIDWGTYFDLKRVKIRMDFYHHKEFFQLNGGVTDFESDQVFSVLGNNRKLLPARWDNLNIKKIETAASLEAIAPIGNSKITGDSSAINLNFKSGTGRFGRVQKAFYFNSRYQLDYFLVNQIFTAQDSFFIQKPYLFDSLVTNDRLRNANFSNVFGFINQDLERNYYLFPFISFQYNERNQNFFRRINSSLFAGFDFEKTSEIQKIIIRSTYCLSGFNQNNYLLNLNFQRKVFLFKHRTDLIFTANLSQNQPSLTEQSFHANRFFWDNNFSSVSQQSISACFKNRWVSFEIMGSRLKNYIFYNADFDPAQNKSAFNFLKSTIAANFETKRIFFLPEIVWQEDFSNGELLRIPSLISKAIFGVNAKLFNKALLLSPGVDILFADLSYGKYFLPQTGQFINQDNTSTGMVFRTNLFVNFTIKELKGYLRMDNVNDGLWPANTNSLLAGYPFPGRVLRIGFIWNLIN